VTFSKPRVAAALRLRIRCHLCWAFAALSLTVAGCSQIGPATIASGRFDYNEAIVRSFDNQMLLNLVRLRYQDSILFLDLTSVVASYSREGRVGASTNTDVANSINPTALSLGATGGVT
jgi:hypothetical protein